MTQGQLSSAENGTGARNRSHLRREVAFLSFGIGLLAQTTVKCIVGTTEQKPKTKQYTTVYLQKTSCGTELGPGREVNLID